MFLRRISKGKDKGNIVKNRRVHLANERTFLAWIRTSIGIMAFGFFMGRFGVQPVSKASSTWSCLRGLCGPVSRPIGCNCGADGHLQVHKDGKGYYRKHVQTLFCTRYNDSHSSWMYWFIAGDLPGHCGISRNLSGLHLFLNPCGGTISFSIRLTDDKRFMSLWGNPVNFRPGCPSAREACPVPVPQHGGRQQGITCPLDFCRHTHIRRPSFLPLSSP